MCAQVSTLIICAQQHFLQLDPANLRRLQRPQTVASQLRAAPIIPQFHTTSPMHYSFNYSVSLYCGIPARYTTDQEITAVCATATLHSQIHSFAVNTGSSVRDGILISTYRASLMPTDPDTATVRLVTSRAEKRRPTYAPGHLPRPRKSPSRTSTPVPNHHPKS